MARHKRILFLADINSVHTQRWVVNLNEQGLKISLFSLSSKTTDWADQIEGFEYKCFGVDDQITRSESRFGKLTYFMAIRELRRFFKSVEPDIVHAHYASSYGMLAMRLKFKRTILSLWGSDVYEFPKRSLFHRFLFKKILRSIPVICSTSKDMAREASNYVVKDYQITPFGVDTEKFIPKETKNNILTIGTVKSLEDVYGIDRLIQLFAKFSNAYTMPARLLIYGSGSKREELELLVSKFGVSDKVEFRGYVKGAALVDAFNSIDIFVALSRSESFGVAVLEAQACGLPVIVSDVGGLPEVVNESTGFVISGEDYEEGVRHLMELSNEQTRREMGRNAREFIEQNYAETECVKKLIAIYDGL